MAIKMWSQCQWNARTGPRCAPKCPSFGPPFGRFGHTFSTNFFYLDLFYELFCSSQLASSSVVPGMPWDARGEPIDTLYLISANKKVPKNPMCKRAKNRALRREKAKNMGRPA